MAIIVTERNPKYCYQGGSLWYTDEHTPNAANARVKNFIVKIKNTDSDPVKLDSCDIRVATLSGSYTSSSGTHYNCFGEPFTATVCVTTSDGTNTHVGGLASRYVTEVHSGSFSGDVWDSSYVNASALTFDFPADDPPILQPDVEYEVQMHMKSIPSYGSHGAIVIFRYLTDTDEIVSTFTLSYDANGGSGQPSSQKIKKGETGVVSTTQPTKSSEQTTITTSFNNNGGSGSTTSLNSTKTTTYPFEKWNTARNGSGTDYQSGSTISISKNTVLYAQYGSSTSYSTITLPTPTRSGSTFAGWYTQSSGGTRVGGGGDTYRPTSSGTLFARWSCRITFNINGDGGSASGGPGTQDVVPGEEVTISSVKPSKTVRLTYYTNTTNNTSSCTATMYGLTNSTPSGTRSKQYYKDITLTFLGWSTTKKQSGTSSDVVVAAGGKYTATGNVTLYAVWKASTLGTLPTYKNSGTAASPGIYRNNDATTNGSSGYKPVGSADYKLDTSAPWTTTANNRSTSVNSSTSIDQNKSIYALWMYRIRSSANGGYFQSIYRYVEDHIEEYTDAQGNVNPPQMSTISEFKTHGTNYTLPGVNSYTSGGVAYTETNPVKSGSSAIGWNLNNSASTASVGLSYVYSYNEPCLYYAIYSPQTYTVRFLLGYGGEDKVLKTISNVPYNSSIRLQDIPVPGRGRYYNGIEFYRQSPFGFISWSGYTSQAVSELKITSNMDFAAVWDFAPIWIMEYSKKLKQKLWVPYKPEEDK